MSILIDVYDVDRLSAYEMLSGWFEVYVVWSETEYSKGLPLSRMINHQREQKITSEILS